MDLASYLDDTKSTAQSVRWTAVWDDKDGDGDIDKKEITIQQTTFTQGKGEKIKSFTDEASISRFFTHEGISKTPYGIGGRTVAAYLDGFDPTEAMIRFAYQYTSTSAFQKLVGKVKTSLDAAKKTMASAGASLKSSSARSCGQKLSTSIESNVDEAIKKAAGDDKAFYGSVTVAGQNADACNRSVYSRGVEVTDLESGATRTYSPPKVSVDAFVSAADAVQKGLELVALTNALQQPPASAKK